MEGRKEESKVRKIRKEERIRQRKEDRKGMGKDKGRREESDERR